MTTNILRYHYFFLLLLPCFLFSFLTVFSTFVQSTSIYYSTTTCVEPSTGNELRPPLTLSIITKADQVQPCQYKLSYELSHQSTTEVDRSLALGLLVQAAVEEAGHPSYAFNWILGNEPERYRQCFVDVTGLHNFKGVQSGPIAFRKITTHSQTSSTAIFNISSVSSLKGLGLGLTQVVVGVSDRCFLCEVVSLVPCGSRSSSDDRFISFGSSLGAGLKAPRTIEPMLNGTKPTSSTNQTAGIGPVRNGNDDPDDDDPLRTKLTTILCATLIGGSLLFVMVVSAFMYWKLRRSYSRQLGPESDLLLPSSSPSSSSSSVSDISSSKTTTTTLPSGLVDTSIIESTITIQTTQPHSSAGCVQEAAIPKSKESDSDTISPPLPPHSGKSYPPSRSIPIPIRTKSECSNNKEFVSSSPPWKGQGLGTSAYTRN
jgi:hypothetical protein